MAKPVTIYVNDVFDTKHFGKCKVIKYIDYDNIHVMFLNTGYVKTVRGDHLRTGNVKDVYAPIVYGIGFFGEGKYSYNKDKKLYQLWYSMIERCYRKEALIKFPTYIDCTVVKRWHNFQNFCEDVIQMKNWNTKGYHLDKDLRVPGNKTYGPEYCSFVPEKINTVFVNTESMTFTANKNGKYIVYCRNGKNKPYLGTFSSKKKAIEVYLNAKSSHLKELAFLYKDQLHPEVMRTLHSAEGLLC